MHRAIAYLSILTLALTAFGCGGGSGQGFEFEWPCGNRPPGGDGPQDDAYDAIGNVLLSIDAIDGVLANDGGGSVLDADATSSEGGDVLVASDGAFTYDPPLGFEGVDTFTYTHEDGAVATVRMTVSEMVWFIDGVTGTGSGDGRYANPFETLAAFNAVQGGGGDDQPEPGDRIFVYEAPDTYDGGIALLNDQTLTGQGVDLVVGGRTIVVATVAPALTNTGDAFEGTGILLADRNRIEGLDVLNASGTGIYGAGVSGPTTVGHTTVTGAGVNGISLIGDCTETFQFEPSVAVIGAANFGVQLGGFGGSGPGFDADVVYEGTIRQTDAGGAIAIDDITPDSSIVFQNGTIEFDGDAFAAIDMHEMQGLCTITSPQTILGMPFIGIFVDTSAGTVTVADTTIDVFDDGFSSSGVELLDVAGATLSFTDLVVTIDGAADTAGGIGLRGGILTGDGAASLTIDGTSSVTMTGAEVAVSVFGTPAAPFGLDVTFQSIAVDGSPQTGGLFLSQCTGAFTVTGPTAIVNFESAGILVLECTCDITFDTLDLANGVGGVGRGIDLNSSAGAFAMTSGSMSNMSLDGCSIDDSNLTLNDMAFSNIGDDVVDLAGVCTVGGTGNTAATFGNLCETVGATVTGSIDFGGLGTCP